MINIDPPCVALCNALNSLKGIRTIESCCGHGGQPFRVWFKATSLKALPQVCYWFDSCHCGFEGWNVIATTDCAKSPVVFMIQGGIGDAAYKQAEKVAEFILEKNNAL